MQHRSISQLLTACFAFALALSLVAPSAQAAGKKKAEDAGETIATLYEEGKTAADAGDFDKALKIFERAHKADAKNPDVLNMLAYSQRKTGKIDEAIANYHRALEIKPRFPEAREYLGEAYLQAALREVETLKSYGEDADHELEDLVEAFREAASKL